jgi:hypothetical protein
MRGQAGGLLQNLLQRYQSNTIYQVVVSIVHMPTQLLVEKELEKLPTKIPE